MESFLGQAARILAERWAGLLALPAVAFLAAASCAFILGPGHALDVTLLASHIGNAGTHLRHHPGAIVVAVATGLLAAVAVSAVASLAGSGVRALWLGEWRWPLRAAARRLTRFRHRRDRARYAVKWPGVDPVPAYFPSRPTWIGDRISLIDRRSRAQYGLYVTLAWPRLWMLMSDSARAPVSAAHGAFVVAATTAGWSALYIVLGLWWPPALAVGGVLGLFAWRRGREAAEDFATIVEAAIDTHQCDLAAALGITLPHGRVTCQEGALINDILQKGG